jgi:hypothetical protein
MQTGLNRLFGNGANYKKSDLVRMMASYFAKVRGFAKPKADQQQAAHWMPEAMAFPAIDPDTQDQQPESEDESAAQSSSRPAPLHWQSGTRWRPNATCAQLFGDRFALD